MANAKTSTDPDGAPRPINPLGLSGAPEIRSVTLEAPWTWLAAGWRDLWQHPALSLGYGLGFALISVGLILGLVSLDLASLSLALAAGFMLVGPMLAVGMYELSRRIQSGAPVTLTSILFVRTKSPVQLAFLGVVMMIVLLAWVRLATLIFALVWGTLEFPPLADFVHDLLFTPTGLTLLVVGSAVGAVLAFLVFAISAVSVPMLMERDLDAMTAAFTSMTAVSRNLWPMLLWAWLIALVMALGIATLFVGMILTFPLIGHATWHAYRDLIAQDAGAGDSGPGGLEGQLKG
ncbi:hypothetical protein CCR85_11505 [Rhodothalassium salexigens]|uniref:DUF2189 domain-containing protein n=1 Tax=Rhodothalassium salexigens TaxID=1086 RepID=UPI00191272E7|nr:DUF2189 domain-containing protein [Rhodothalassium salexigens]MBK5912115.1 hypothetical protein [Rhodothalassium salexigens]